MATTTKFIVNTEIHNKWKHTDDKVLSDVINEGKHNLSLTIEDGQGNDRANLGWYQTFFLTPGESREFDLNNLSETVYGGYTIQKDFHLVKLFEIETISPSATFIVGSSGVASGVTFLGSVHEIGTSGVLSLVTPVGYEIGDSGNLVVKNPDNIKNLICNLIVIGES